jgi:ABC-type Fe3+/spermidine/putrescine transport system ATPase subunit
LFYCRRSLDGSNCRASFDSSEKRCRNRTFCGPRLTSKDRCFARHIVKSVAGIKAVQDVDISIADRTLHALIGPNGPGKTTAYNLLSGMYPPDQGSVSLLGQPIVFRRGVSTMISAGAHHPI